MQDAGTDPISVARQEPSRQSARRHRFSADLWTPALLACLMLFHVWTRRQEHDLSAKPGAGYWIGVLGSLMMLALLIYPLRSRLPSLRAIGSVPGWFRVHMLLGVGGPALIQVHSGFRLGALDSRVALFSMLIVAGSGLVARFLHARIHLAGFTGRSRACATGWIIWRRNGARSQHRKNGAPHSKPIRPAGFRPGPADV